MDVPELAPDDPLLRRFHPLNGVIVDEGTGEVRLNWCALRFDDDGCSVYRERVLGLLGLARTEILTQEYTSLAASTKDEIERHEFCHEGKPLRLFSAKGSPRTEPPPEDADPAHALIFCRPNGLSKRKLGKVQRSLAAAFAVVLHKSA